MRFITSVSLAPDREGETTMHRKALSLAFALLLAAAHAPAQTASKNNDAARQAQPAAQKPAPTPAEESGEEVVRITSKLVQLDVVVTDREGRQVTDLRAEDFEILEDGRPQQITNFSYVSTGPAPQPAPASPKEARAAAASAPPPVAPRRERVRRTIAVVVDDLGMSFTTTVQVRDALRRFINEQVQPGDLVAIIRTGGEVGALQQFTNDRRQLLAAIERVRWNNYSRVGLYASAPVSGGFLAGVRPGCSNGSERGTLEGLRFIIAGMRELPGRKSIVFFSDSVPFEEQEQTEGLPQGTGVGLPPRAGQPADYPDAQLPSDRVGCGNSYVDPLRSIAELAVRASVVIYAVDARGLQTESFTAADDIDGLSPQQLSERMGGRAADINRGQEGGTLLAAETGGLMFKNNNDLDLGLRRVMEDQRGYYLIGYKPGGETFNRRFHRIAARVKGRPDLRVRTRHGFYGVTDEDARPAVPTAADRFQLALASPFAASDLDVRLTPVFTSLPAAGPVLRSVLHIDARGLDFKQEADGWRSTQLVLRAVLFGDNGRIVDEHRRAFTLRLRGATFERVQSQGIDYVFNMPAKKPGAYQFRVAVLDESSSRVGSAGQYVEVPDVKKNALALSGVVLSGGGPRAVATGASAPARSATDEAEGTLQPQEANDSARRFRQGAALDYSYLVFNAGGGKSAATPRLSERVRLFRDGQPVFDHESAAAVARQLDPSRAVVAGRLQLGADLRPGDYVLQITVTDPLAKKGHEAATEWVDFEVVRQ
jgi:VWFA-related protein